MNAVSFSLFGNRPIYVVGAVRNACLVTRFYPGWEAVFHVERGHETVPWLKGCGACVIEHEPEPGMGGTFWRFETLGDIRYERVVCRDADSRIGWREVAAVNDWIQRDTTLHTMWDWPRPRRRPVSGGMFGLKTGCWDVMAERAAWMTTGLWGDDEEFLQQRLWPHVHRDVTAHARRPGPGELHFPAAGRRVGARVRP